MRLVVRMARVESRSVSVLPIRKTPCAYTQNTLRLYAKSPRLYAKSNDKFPHDPSDHVIISHAMTLHMPLISSDTRFPFYRRQGLDFIYNEK